jgi:hypothetical protein
MGQPPLAHPHAKHLYELSVSTRCDALHLSHSADHDFRDAFQTWQFEHGVEQNALHDRAQSARPGLALYRFAGDADHLEQPMVLFDQRVLRLDRTVLCHHFEDRRYARNPSGSR